MIPGVLFGLCWCCDFFARAICRGPLGWKFLIEKSQLRWFPNFSRPWCSTTRRMWWGQPYHPLKSVRRDIFVFDLRYLRKQEPQEGVFKMILRIIWETKIGIHNEFDCMEIEFGFIRSLPLKCCHSPLSVGVGFTESPVFRRWETMGRRIPVIPRKWSWTCAVNTSLKPCRFGLDHQNETSGIYGSTVVMSRGTM